MWQVRRNDLMQRSLKKTRYSDSRGGVFGDGSANTKRTADDISRKRCFKRGTADRSAD
jgi:hypothetical protein